MSHTPEQAKELWCPMVRLAGCLPNGEVQPGQTVVNRLQINLNSGAEIPSSSKCLAEKCSMWRWEPKKYMDGSILYGESSTHGYCGLAGRPEVML